VFDDRSIYVGDGYWYDETEDNYYYFDEKNGKYYWDDDYDEDAHDFYEDFYDDDDDFFFNDDIRITYLRPSGSSDSSKSYADRLQELEQLRPWLTPEEFDTLKKQYEEEENKKKKP
jgi:hypothetical protein